ncbi:hypothetical protein ARMGADRAFT_1166672 [Armillaria gallica]|uniref:Uncharacterized protein n=1 Tax=Armillaria gallica TaxID=47427 RepID=A0A2H3DNJ5_ARMGA|nr:hypothetical protein ARMGADRAFT_1166672 [Armillaria gallica]
MQPAHRTLTRHHLQPQLRPMISGKPTLHLAGVKLKRFCKWDPHDALDRVVILRSTADADSVQAHCPCHVLMTIDFRQVQRRVTLEDFLLLVQSTSRNTTRYHVVFSQCYWFVYKISAIHGSPCGEYLVYFVLNWDFLFLNPSDLY